MKSILVPIGAATAVLLSGCATNRHLVFFTNTTLGIEIAAEPNATTPAKFIVGYKRAEGVIDPIADDTVTTGTGARNAPVRMLKPEGHSVLAKLNFGASGAGANATNAQWFATGEAARRLAQAPGIAGAITGSESIARAAAVQSAVQLGSTPEGRLSRLAVLDGLYDQLTKAAPKDAAAASLVSRLDALDFTTQAPAFTQYSSSPRSKDALLKASRAALPKGHKFLDALTYHGDLNSSMGALKAQLDPFNANLKEESGGNLVAATAGFAATAATDFASQRDLLAALDKKLANDPAVVEAIRYFTSLLLAP